MRTEAEELDAASVSGGQPIRRVMIQITTLIISFPIQNSEYEVLVRRWRQHVKVFINSLNPELNPICYLLALLGTHHFLHVSRIRVKLLTLRRLMSYIYIYGAPILDVSRSHTTMQHSR